MEEYTEEIEVSEDEESQQEVPDDESSEDREPTEGDDSKKAAPKVKAERLSDDQLDRMVTIKVDGQEQEMTVREAIKLQQLEQTSRKKMQEAAEAKKSAAKEVMGQIMRYAKENPRAFLQKTGIDPYEFAEMTLAEKLEELNLTEEQRELRDLRREKEQLEMTQKQREEQDRKSKEDQEYQDEALKLEQEFTEAWGETGLPKDKFFLADTAKVMLSAAKQGKNLSVKEAASIVKARFQDSLKNILPQMDVQTIREVAGEDILKRLRQSDLERLEQNAERLGSSNKRPGASNKQSASGKSQSKTMKEKDYQKWKEDFERSLGI